MWPIVGLGVASIAAAVQFALSGRRELLRFSRAMGSCTILCGVFGTTIGWMRVLAFASERFGETAFDLPGDSEPVQRLMLLAIGTREALNCVAAALLFAALAAFVVALGLRRDPTLPQPLEEMG